MNTKLTIHELNRPNADEYERTRKIPVTIVLENIRSRSNIGSVFRSADAFVIEEVLLCGYTARPPHRDIQKTALGATETVKWRGFESTIDAITVLRESGYSIWAVEQTSESIDINAFNFQSNRPIAMILGNEVHGVEQATIDQCDGAIEIAQFGTKHSLNVSVCAGIVMFAANRQLIASS